MIYVTVYRQLTQSLLAQLVLEGKMEKGAQNVLYDVSHLHFNYIMSKHSSRNGTYKPLFVTVVLIGLTPHVTMSERHKCVYFLSSVMHISRKLQCPLKLRIYLRHFKL